MAHSTVLKENDPSCHTEVNAIRLAARRLGSYDLSGAAIYSTTGPCPMCFAAIHWARLGHLVYGTAIEEAAALGFNELTISNEQMKAAGQSPVAIYPNFLVAECRELLRSGWQSPDGRPIRIFQMEKPSGLLLGADLINWGEIIVPGDGSRAALLEGEGYGQTWT